ncbi:MAG: ankyrin repeat domain-containing protein [Bdellovibrionales bacterium]
MTNNQVKKDFDVAKAIVKLPVEGQLRLFQQAVDENNVVALNSILSALSYKVQFKIIYYANEAIYNAAQFGRACIFAELLRIEGINVNWQNEYHNYQSPLMRAVANDHEYIIEYLLARDDLDINAETLDGKCAANFANTEKTIKQLLDDPRLNEKGRSILNNRLAEIEHEMNLARKQFKEIYIEPSDNSSALEKKMGPIRRALKLSSNNGGNFLG